MLLKIKFNHIFWIGILLVAFLSSCSSEKNPSLQPKPKAYSKLNELTVIADTALWNGPVGDTFRYYFESPYLILPQPEPMFDLRHFTARQLSEESIYRSYRYYILLGDMSRDGSITNKLITSDLGEDKVNSELAEKGGSSSVGKNKWATNQTVFYLYGADTENLAEVIGKAYPSIKKRIHENDADRVSATVFQGGSDGGISTRILEQYGAQMKIPKDYKVAIDDGEVMWLRKETSDLSGNILIAKYPYTSPDQMSTENLKKIRDELGKKYVSSNIQGSYMRTNDEDLPLFVDQITHKNRYAKEIHGIWELENDFMGGPFVSLAIVNEDKGELLFLDGFIFSPGEPKRNSMQYMEAILKSVRF
ncbi:MAG: DUF4837 family protein [Saprospiraceae bacterium]|nr:DUF4837 family protein [Saprospiraceae bacterium]